MELLDVSTASILEDAANQVYRKIQELGEENPDEAEKWTLIATTLAEAGVDGSALGDIELDDLTDLDINRFDAKKLMGIMSEVAQDYNGHPFDDPAIQPEGDYEELASKYRRYNEAFYLGSERRASLLEEGTYTVPHVEIACVIILVVVIIQMFQSCMADWYDDFVEENNFTWIMLVLLAISILRFGHFLIECMACLGAFVFITILKCLCGLKCCNSDDDDEEPPLEEEEEGDDDNTCCGGIFECDLAANQNSIDSALLDSFVSRHQPDKIKSLADSIKALHKTFRAEGGDDEKDGQDDGEVFRNTIRALSSNDLVSLRTGHGADKSGQPPPWLAGLKGVVPEDMRLFQYLAESRSFDDFFTCEGRGAEDNHKAVKEMLAIYPGRGQQYAMFTLGPMSYTVLMTRMRGTLFASLIPVVLIVCLYMIGLQFVFQRFCFESAGCIRKFEAVTETLSFWHDYIFWLMAFGILDGSSDMIEKWHDIQEKCWAIRKDILNNAIMFGMGCDDEARRYQMYRYLQVLHFYAYVTPNVVINKDSRPPLIHSLSPIINNVFKYSNILTQAEFDVLEEYDPMERWQVVISWINDMYKQREKEEEDVCPNWDQPPWLVREKIRDLHERMQMIRPFSHMQLLEYIIYAYLVSLPVEGTYVLLFAGPTVIDFQVVDFFFAIIIAAFTSGLMKFQMVADQPFKYGNADGLKPISLIRDAEAACLLYLRKPWSSKMVDADGKNTLRWDPEEEEEEEEEAAAEEPEDEEDPAGGGADRRTETRGPAASDDDLETIDDQPSQHSNEDAPLKLESKRRHNGGRARAQTTSSGRDEFETNSQDPGTSVRPGMDYDNGRSGGDEGVVARDRERRREERARADRPRKERRQQAVELQPRQGDRQVRSAPAGGPEDQPDRRRRNRERADRYEREHDRAGRQDQFREDRYEPERREERPRYRDSGSPNGRDDRDRRERRDRSERRDRERNRRSKKEYAPRQEKEWFPGH